MPVMRRPGPPPDPGVPAWLQNALDTLSLLPVATAVPTRAAGQFAGKAANDLLGEVLQLAAPVKGLPTRMRLTSLDPAAGTAMLHGSASGQPVTAGLEDLRRLYQGGTLAKEGLPGEGASLATLVKRLKALVP